ncbi:MAG: uridine phosphorylase [Eubacteriales bacterium]|nr:uridine phosphorylase [Eubacteriales bacterium]
MNENGLQYHIRCSPGDIGEYVMLPGDPGRCEKIAAHFNNPRFVVSNREFTAYTGLLDGVKISAVSTGIGGPSAAIAMEELANIGATKFIRVGTCGGISTKVRAGDLVIAMSAVRQDGTSREYAPEGYPATADFDLTLALVRASEKLGLGAKTHIGVVQAKDSFYGQHSPERMPVSDMLQSKWNAYKKLGVLASEMESAALFTVAASRGLKCAAVFAAVWNQEREKAGLGQNGVFDTDIAIKCAVEAFRLVIQKDQRQIKA